MKKKLPIFLLYLSIFTTLVFAVKFTMYDKKRGNSIREEYPLIQKIDNINGIILERKNIYSIFNKGHMVNVSDGSKFNPNIIQSINTKYLFHDFILIGDSILKNKDSDTIYVYRNMKEYVFVMNYRKGN